MLKSLSLAALLAGGAALLSACGNTDLERGATGGALGGVAGYALGAPVAGALVGGATGVFTESDDLNLGAPIWEWD